MPSCDFCILPSVRSMRCVILRTSKGDDSVVKIAAELRNWFEDSKPSGAVITGRETETGFSPSCFRSSKAESKEYRVAHQSVISIASPYGPNL